ncbi:MAG: homoserine dehydrogenase [Stappiaceae bacterium]
MADALKLGIAGLGTVGASLANILNTHSEVLTSRSGRPITIAAVCARDRAKDRGIDLSDATWFSDPVALARSEAIDVFVELIGGDSGPAEKSVRAAIDCGKHVVTANKALLAKHGNSLARAAEAKGVSLNYEAAVAGGIPIIKTLRETLTGNQVSRIYGILNGTCNYILTRMEQDRISFEECLTDAQRLGYAEADPTFDVEGFDSAHKLAILTSLAFGTEIEADSIYVEGISSITTADIEAATELGYRIKLLGVAQITETGIEQRVHPTMVPIASSIARVDGVLNAVAVDADFVSEIILAGPGAGGNATASAVAGDITDIARGISVPVLARPADQLRPYQRARMRLHEGGYYIRLSVYDRPGAFASIAKAMAAHSISLESIVQRRRNGQFAQSAVDAVDPQPVILITHETTENAVKDALEAIAADNVIAEKPQMIRIEKLD